jgi:hypothetical protein
MKEGADMSRWRSGAVVLAVLGAAAVLNGCGQPEYRRNGYASRADCLKDYPADKCEARSGAGTGFLYFGPWFLGNQRNAVAGDPGPGRTAVNGVSQSATPGASETRRGGFGSTGRSNVGYRGG